MYRPGTSDDVEYIRRVNRKMRRVTSEAVTASESQVYGTTGKMKEFDGNVSALEQRVADVETVAEANRLKLESVEEGANKTVISDVATGPNPPSGDAVASAIAAAVSGIAEVTFAVVDELPETGDALTFYFVPRENADEDDRMDEWVYVAGSWEHVGSPRVVLPISAPGTPGILEPDDETVTVDTAGVASAWTPAVGCCVDTTGSQPGYPGIWAKVTDYMLAMTDDATVYTRWERTG